MISLLIGVGPYLQKRDLSFWRQLLLDKTVEW